MGGNKTDDKTEKDEVSEMYVSPKKLKKNFKVDDKND